MKKRSTKSAILVSALSMLLCVSMLIGTTFAWFTDSVTSGNNMISAGTLDVGLEYMNAETEKWTEVEADTNVFMSDVFWEPGHVEVIKLRVSNIGSLALKYQLGINIISEQGSINKAGNDFKLSDYIYFGTVAGDVTYATREDAIAAVADGAKLIKEGCTLPSELTAGATPEVVTLVVYMPSTVGNEANHAASANVPEIKLGISLIATQAVAESDSFGDGTYDEDAKFPELNTTVVPEGSSEPIPVTVGNVTVYVPAGAAAGVYELEVGNKSLTTANGTSTVSYDITLRKDGNKVSGVHYATEIQVEPLLDVVSVTHNGNPIENYKYDAMTGIVSFETDSFSPFAVTYATIVAENPEIENGRIVSGVFEGVNPATLDPTLAEADSEYIAINYEKDGKTYFVVNKRATTKILAADAAEGYTAINGNYEVAKNQSGKLWNVFKGLENEEFSTVYLLPGTYNEATVIYVYSSMDIIGLGDKDTVKVIKAAGVSSSNRHLFNCSGSKEEYIHVTIRNLYLDASEFTSNGKDNAAVQAILRAKVKCYDLTVIKAANNSGSCAFYANGNNKVAGETAYSAGYMYIENCWVNNAQKMGVVEWQPGRDSRVYYNNVLYNNGQSVYDHTSTYIKNQVMEPDDWEW